MGFIYSCESERFPAYLSKILELSKKSKGSKMILSYFVSMFYATVLIMYRKLGEIFIIK